MTAEEAKTKWCPFSRVIGEADGAPAQSFNRGSTWDDKTKHWVAAVPVEARCIASECMAWRPFYGQGMNGKGQCGLAALPPSALV